MSKMFASKLHALKSSVTPTPRMHGGTSGNPAAPIELGSHASISKPAGEEGAHWESGGAMPAAGGHAAAARRARVDLDTRRAQGVVLAMVLLDLGLAVATLFEAVYDPALPSALDPTLLITHTLNTSLLAFSIARILLFTLTLLLRVVFALEIVLRVMSLGPAHYLRSPQRIVDALVVLLALLLHMCLPAREALLCNFIIGLRLCWRTPLWIHTRERDLAAIHARAADQTKRERDAEMQALMLTNSRLKQQLTDQRHKMNILTGDVGIMDADLASASNPADRGYYL
ncbi:hypothetical protein DFJ77DRAFT_474073 [Powellomyces hirtus]|nr:hypothetical protein DFJ77DRAFT_474073 [Powellomyces hirtus]